MAAAGMFKGQGANTALADGVALARWLTQRPLRPALACFEREMIARAGPRVKASREAEESLHSPEVLSPTTPHPFAGVKQELHGPLRAALREAGICAAMVADGEDESLVKLEEALITTLAELEGSVDASVGEGEHTPPPSRKSQRVSSVVPAAAAIG